MEPNVHFAGRDIINAYDFTNQELCHIMDTAMIYEKRVKSGEVIKDLAGMTVATLFFEPSTRTRLSFQAAINRVGASCIDLGSASASSQAKGETWQDTIKTVDGYVDAIVMRTPSPAPHRRPPIWPYIPLSTAATAPASTPRRRCWTSTPCARRPVIWAARPSPSSAT